MYLTMTYLHNSLKFTKKYVQGTKKKKNLNIETFNTFIANIELIKFNFFCTSYVPIIWVSKVNFSGINVCHC